MNAQTDLAELSDGIGLMAELDASQSLVELTSVVTSICSDIESRNERSVLVVRLGATSKGCREWPGDVTIQAVNRWERAVRRLEQLPAASVAVAAGTCGGPALDLLLAFDFRIAAPDFRLMLPVSDGHFWPGMSVFRLVRHAGLARARQIVLWDTDMPLAMATELSLIDRVSDDIPEAVRTATALIGRISGREMAVRRQLLDEAGTVEYDDALGVHLAACDRELRRLREAGAGAALDAAERAHP
jgi:isomerase DpgB